jgi:hypothetical protein
MRAMRLNVERPLAALAALLALTVLAVRAGAAEPLAVLAVPPDDELECSGAVIGDITIDNQDIFDTRDPHENKSLFRLANRLHYETRPQVIRNQLLFKSGDPYSRRILDESARLLRANRYFYDASVRPVALHDGKVDINVTTRDVWTLNPGISFGRRGGRNHSGIELEELNLLGRGIELSAARKSGVDRNESRFQFADRHVRGSRVAIDGLYSSNSDGSERALDIERPFYALDARWSAGANWVDADRLDSLYDRGEIVDQFRERHKFVRAYAGRSAGLQHGWVRRWTWGADYDESRFSVDPATPVPTVVPADRKLVYPWLGFDLIEDKYAPLRNHDQIERTEDFYLGTRVRARLGWINSAFGADRNAALVELSAGRGFLTSENGTLLLGTSLAARIASGQEHNSLLGAELRYYLKQSEKRLFFATLDADVGHNLDVDKRLELGGDNGLRGYPLRYQSGDQRLLVTVEQRYFTDWYPFRLFRVGGAIFFDVGRTWGTSPTGAPSLGWLKDAGIGLRLGNSRSGLGNIIHVDVAFPFDGDPSIKNIQFLIETKRRF